MRPCSLILSSLLLPSALAAQSPAAGAASITQADVKRRIFIIAHDSMGGRDTPSPGLEKTAAYIGAEFKRFGLKPGGDSGGFIQRYPLRQVQIDTAGSEVLADGPEGAHLQLRIGRDAVLFRGPMQSGKWPIVLAGGPPDSVNPAPNAFRGKAVVWYPDSRLGWVGIQQGGRNLLRGGAALVMVSVAEDSILNPLLPLVGRPRLMVGSSSGTIWLAARESAVAAQIPQSVESAAALHGAQSFTVQEIDDWIMTLRVKEKVLKDERAPNTVGILPGTDPELRNEYIVFSAHMDHVGTAGRPGSNCGAVGADSICNGADDDGSGTVGIVELAEAFSRPGARPKRSLIFLTVSGEEHGLWGSDYFASHPPVPIGQIVADLNADMIGRNWKDTIVVIGREHSDLGQTLARVNAKHPELRMSAIDDLWPQESFYTRSDHFNFAKHGVPVLFFFNGTHPDYHRPSDQPEKIDGEKEARILRLMYWLGLEVGNATERPKWDQASYTKFVTDK